MDEYTFLPYGLQRVQTNTRLGTASTQDAPRPKDALWDLQPRASQTNIRYAHTDASRRHAARQPQYTPSDTRSRPSRNDSKHSPPDTIPNLYAAKEFQHGLPNIPSQLDHINREDSFRDDIPVVNVAQEREDALLGHQAAPSMDVKDSHPSVSLHPHADASGAEYPLPDQHHLTRVNTKYPRPDATSRPQAGTEETQYPLPDPRDRPSRGGSKYSRSGAASRPQVSEATVHESDRPIPDRQRRPSRGSTKYSHLGTTSRPSEAAPTAADPDRPLPDPQPRPFRVDSRYSRPGAATTQEPERPLPDPQPRPSRVDSNYSRPGPVTTQELERPLPDPQPRPSRVDSKYSRPGPATAQEHEHNLPNPQPRPSRMSNNYSRPGATFRPQAGAETKQEPERPLPDFQPRPSQANNNSSRPGGAGSSTSRTQTGAATAQEPKHPPSKPQPRPSLVNPSSGATRHDSATTTQKLEPTASDLEPTKSSQMHTKYVNMLLALDTIPRLDNMLASFFTWILLAGFILFPGTFTSLQNSQSAVANGEVGKEVLKAVAHVPLFVIAFLCCGIGGIGMCYLWWKWMYNYIWLVNKIFMPGLLNSLAGLISTITNVFGVQHGEFSTTSKVTIIVTAVSTFICGVLTLFYSLWKIRRIKKKHDKEVGAEAAGRHGEGIVEEVKRKTAK